MDEFTKFERDAWDEKAHAFADTWGAVTIQNIETILQLCSIGEKRRVLDVGCGGGELAQAAHLRGALVTALDASSNMCAIARKRYPHLRVLECEAEDLPCEDREYSTVILNYLLLHVFDQKRVLQEAARVVAPEGVLCWSNWAPPEFSVGMEILFGALKKFADFTVIPPAPDIFQFSDRKRADELLGSLGFEGVQCTVFPSAWIVASGAQFFEAIQGGTRIGGLIQLQQPAVKESIKSVIIDAVEGRRKGSSCIVPMPTHIFTVQRCYAR